jgi:hypothetical protein
MRNGVRNDIVNFFATPVIANLWRRSGISSGLAAPCPNGAAKKRNDTEIVLVVMDCIGVELF